MTEPTEVNTTQLPDFDAMMTWLRGKRDANGMDGYDVKKVEDWIEKLNQWCSTILDEVEEQEQQLQDAQRETQKALEDLHEALCEKEHLEELSEGLDDVKRGVRTFEEIMEMNS